MADLIKLNKYLANSGVASRRTVKELIKNGEVIVNGDKIFEAAFKINPEKDEIKVLGKKIEKNSNISYIILNKPLEVVSTTSDEKGRTTVTDLVNSKIKLYPVGRLDADSIGLILLTNDGELTHKLTHPKFHIPKTYQVMVHGKVKETQLKKLRNGIKLKEGMTLPATVEILEEFKFTTKLKFIIHEGRNRQIRRMCGVVNLEVLELKRVGLGPIKLGDLEEGKSRNLTEEEILNLKKAAGI